MDHYWESIKLTPKELKKYKKIAGKLSVANENETANPLFIEVFTSDAYSSNFRRCLVLHLSLNRQARLWGFGNLKGRDLFELVSKVAYHPTKEFTEQEVDALISNSDFLASASIKDDSTFNMLFYVIINRKLQRAIVKDRLVENVINLNLMNMCLAEFVITSDIESYGKNEESKRLVIEWARKEYNLEDLPDLWITKLLSC